MFELLLSLVTVQPSFTCLIDGRFVCLLEKKVPPARAGAGSSTSTAAAGTASGGAGTDARRQSGNMAQLQNTMHQTRAALGDRGEKISDIGATARSRLPCSFFLHACQVNSCLSRADVVLGVVVVYRPLLRHSQVAR